MSLPTDDILPEEPTGEVVHWMEPRPMQVGPAGISAAAATAFLVGVAATVGAFLLWRYMAPRREGLPPWRWGRGPLH
ncbi:hypothetical protein [Phenylobacterium zucineum]|uniref:hypothetical protein n=1 Tax=Phenylobacterium zucineum TaxID=284016 RepID=UPI0002EF68E1|nr:hypothetical protein [Phenylobacterium zucineum]